MAKTRDMSKSSFFHAHCHSQFSTVDGMVPPATMVNKAYRYGQPAIAFTEHGNMGSFVQGYLEAKRLGMKFFPGIEGYLIDPQVENWKEPEKGQKVGRFHFIVLALNEDGYKALVKFTTLTHTRPRFNRFPRATLSDLATLGTNHGKDLVLLTGCYFGLLQQTLVSKGYESAGRVLDMYSKWFPNTYVELQNHNIDHGDDDNVSPDFADDVDIVDALYDLAMERNLPVIATQDCHYLDQGQKKAHNLMKKMVYAGGDDEFPGDSFHLASADWVAEHYDDEIWDACEESYAKLLEMNTLSIDPLDNYKPDVPLMPGVDDPVAEVHDGCVEALEEYLDRMRIPKSKHSGYWDRLEYEEEVINQLGMASYFVIWQKFADWCRDEKIAIEARGSANGSLVAFLMRITQVDPVLWNVDFARFLSVDRISPPDVDMDIEDSERPRAVKYLLSLFEACQIGTWGKMGITYDEREDTQKGSILVTYVSYLRRQCEKRASAIIERRGGRKSDVKAYAQAIFQKEYGYLEDIRDVKKVSEKDYTALKQMADMNSVYKSYGVHAGGILLSGQRIKIDDYIPKMLVASSDTHVSQYDMNDVEKFGLLKMDVLGQATLRTMKLAQQHMEVEDPADFSWIKNDDKDACKNLRSGRTNTGVFHIEAPTKSRGGRELGVKTTKDAILVQALYMPGAMDSGQTEHYIRARKDKKYRDTIKYVHPIFERHLKETYGAYVFQNQVLAILRDMGMSIPDTNKFLKIVKSSGSGAKEANAKKLAEIYEHFVDMWDKHNIPHDRLKETWESLCGFGAYGFNKAHASGYGIRMYRCAYLKEHYPLEFMTATLITWAGRTKEKIYMREARRIGIRLMPPDINISGASWAMDKRRNAIRRGLVTIAGIGDKVALAIATERQRNGSYESVEDLISRLEPRVMTGGAKYLKTGEITGNLKKLYDAGVLRSIMDDED